MKWSDVNEEDVQDIPTDELEGFLADAYESRKGELMAADRARHIQDVEASIMHTGFADDIKESYIDIILKELMERRRA